MNIPYKKCFPILALCFSLLIPLKLFTAAAALESKNDYSGSLEGDEPIQDSTSYFFKFEGDSSSQAVEFPSYLLGVAPLLQTLANPPAGEIISLRRSYHYENFSWKEIRALLSAFVDNRLVSYVEHKTISELFALARFSNFLGAEKLLDQITHIIAQKLIALGPLEDPNGIGAYKKEVPDDIQRMVVDHILTLRPHDFFFNPNFIKDRDGTVVAKYAKNLGEYAYSVEWSPDGTKLAAISMDGAVRIWDAHSGREEFVKAGHREVSATVTWSPDGTRLASTNNGTIHIWDVRSGREELAIEAGIAYSVAWSPDGTKLASTDDDGIHVWDAQSGREELAIGAYIVHSVVWGPDSTKLASVSGPMDGVIRIWDARSGKKELTIDRHIEFGNSVAWNPDGTKLSGSKDGVIHIWDARSGKEELTIDGHTRRVYSVAWSPDGIRLASKAADGTIRIWDAHSGKEELIIAGRTKDVYLRAFGQVAWSPDSTRLASSGLGEDAIRIYDIKEIQKEIKKINRMTFKQLLDLGSPPYPWACIAAGCAVAGYTGLKLFQHFTKSNNP